MFNHFIEQMNLGMGAGGGSDVMKRVLQCRSVAMHPDNKEKMEKGGKILLPPSALDQLSRMNVQYPMLFKISNPKLDRSTHCGVLEFVAEEGTIYMPFWMMQILHVTENMSVNVTSVNLVTAKYAKFQPQCTEFLDLVNPRAVLENNLREFACLTLGDTIAIYYNDKVYYLLVRELRPADAVCIIETDMVTEFDTPIGHEEANAAAGTSRTRDASISGGPMTELERIQREQRVIIEERIKDQLQHPFLTRGSTTHKPEGNKPKDELIDKMVADVIGKGVTPDYSYTPGSLFFNRLTFGEKPPENGTFEAFSGHGSNLKAKKQRKL